MKAKTPECAVLRIEQWPVARLLPYARNPRRNDAAVPRMVESIRQFGFAIPVLARSDGLIVDGHLRLKAALVLNIETVPVIPCDDWTEAQVKAFRLMVNRSVSWADCDNASRSAVLMEIAPTYVDVIVQRWQTLTSREATLEGDGRTFAAVSGERLAPSKRNTSRAIKKKAKR